MGVQSEIERPILETQDSIAKEKKQHNITKSTKQRRKDATIRGGGSSGAVETKETIIQIRNTQVEEIKED